MGDIGSFPVEFRLDEVIGSPAVWVSNKLLCHSTTDLAMNIKVTPGGRDSARAASFPEGETFGDKILSLANRRMADIDLGARDDDFEVQEGVRHILSDRALIGETETVLCGPTSDKRFARRNLVFLPPSQIPDYTSFYFGVHDDELQSETHLRIAAEVWNDPALAGETVALQYVNTQADPDISSGSVCRRLPESTVERATKISVGGVQARPRTRSLAWEDAPHGVECRVRRACSKPCYL